MMSKFLVYFLLFLKDDFNTYFNIGKLLLDVLKIYHLKTLSDGDYLKRNVIIYIRMEKEEKRWRIWSYCVLRVNQSKEKVS